ncbi:MAG: ABC transporter substrate-binding protein [Fibromonadaceae bacterium]|jgi:NitT/TauT family transport system substrate-binding protein|nr:ABC transporter substrate-binding protein [Fibromonadaceae bacterium]
MKNNFFIKLGAIAAIAIGMFFVSCTKKGDLETVRVAQFNEFFLYMPLYLADAKGFFAEEGLRIEVVNTGGDDKTLAAVMGGSAMFGIADPTFAAIAKERGGDGKVIASIVNGVPFWGVTRNHEIPEITDPAQLSGYSVATFPEPSTAFLLQRDMFERAGLRPNIRQGAFGTLWTMVEAGQADIALELEPNVSIAANQGGKVLYSLAEVYGDFAITGVTVRERTTKKRPEIVQRFVNALQKSAQFAHAYPDSVALYAEKLFPNIDRTVSANAINRVISTNTLPKDVIISEEAWEKAIQQRHGVGEIRSLETARSVLDMSFAKKAVEGRK